MQKLEKIKPTTKRGWFTLGALTFAIVMVLGSSYYVFARAGDYHQIFSDENLDVSIRIEKINPNPSKFAIAIASVKIKNLSPSDIYVHEFTVYAYSSSPRNSDCKKFGEGSRTDVNLPAESTVVTKVNTKIENYTDFRNTDLVYVQSYIRWSHFGFTYERWDFKYIDISGYTWMLPNL